MSADLVFTSRYGGGPLPDPETMCDGDCEGIGCYPDMDNRSKYASIDDVPFIKCERCNGTGKRAKP